MLRFGKNMDLAQLAQELKELEKEESRIKRELEEKYNIRGCIVPKMIHCKGREYGPYYYLTWKEGGKQYWKLLGKQFPKDLAEKLQKRRELKQRLKEIRKRKEELKKMIKAIL